MKWHQWVQWRLFGTQYVAIVDAVGAVTVCRKHTTPMGVSLAYWADAIPVVLNKDGTVTGQKRWAPHGSIEAKMWRPLTPEPPPPRLTAEEVQVLSVEELEKRIEQIEGAR